MFRFRTNHTYRCIWRDYTQDKRVHGKCECVNNFSHTFGMLPASKWLLCMFLFFFYFYFQLSLELTSKILSQCSEDTAQLTRLIKLLTQIRTDLNRRKMCMLQGSFKCSHNLRYLHIYHASRWPHWIHMQANAKT